MTQKFHVTADNATPAWRLDRETFVVGTYRDLFDVRCAKLGHSGAFKTPEMAIHAICADHACANIRIEEA